MGRIYFINECKRHIAAGKGFALWKHRFGIAFDYNTSIRLLDNPIVKYLVRGDEDSSAALHELIMGVRGLGRSPRFHYLDSDSKMGVTDVTLFLLDLVRFEAMYRMGWLENYPLLEVPLVDLIQTFKDRYTTARHNSPSICRNHPLYKSYEAEFEGDRHSFVRKLIPEAIRTFCAEDDPTDRE